MKVLEILWSKNLNITNNDLAITTAFKYAFTPYQPEAHRSKGSAQVSDGPVTRQWSLKESERELFCIEALSSLLDGVLHVSRIESFGQKVPSASPSPIKSFHLRHKAKPKHPNFPTQWCMPRHKYTALPGRGKSPRVLKMMHPD